MPDPFQQRQSRLWRLERNYKVLANQRLVLETLRMALETGYGDSDWYDKGTALLKLVVDEVYTTCDLIVQDSDFFRAGSLEE